MQVQSLSSKREVLSLRLEWPPLGALRSRCRDFDLLCKKTAAPQAKRKRKKNEKKKQPPFFSRLPDSFFGHNFLLFLHTSKGRDQRWNGRQNEKQNCSRERESLVGSLPLFSTLCPPLSLLSSLSPPETRRSFLLSTLSSRRPGTRACRSSGAA